MDSLRGTRGGFKLATPPERLDRKLVDSIEDFVEFDNFFRGSLGLNPHEAYGYLAQPLLAEIVGDWIERGFDGPP